jgi:hypothetical protein
MQNTEAVKLNTDGLPYGTASLNMRKGKWWVIYTNADGTRIQKATSTDDRNAALVIAAQQAIAVLKAKLEVLQGIVHDAKAAKGHAKAGAGRSRGGQQAGAPAKADAGNRPRGSKGGTR